MAIYLYSTLIGMDSSLGQRIFEISGQLPQFIRDLGQATTLATQSFQMCLSGRSCNDFHLFLFTDESKSQKLLDEIGKGAQTPEAMAQIYLSNSKQSPWDWLTSALVKHRTVASATSEGSDKDTAVIGPAHSFVAAGNLDFLKGIKCPCDFFIRTSPNKYIKAVSEGDPYAADMLIHHESKGRTLYLRRSDQGRYANALSSQVIDSMSGNPPKDVPQILACTEALFSAAKAEAMNAGIREDTTLAAFKVVNSMVEDLATNNLLGGKLRQEILGQYIRRPANMLVSLLSQSILLNLKWSNTSSVEKMALACMMRDIGLPQDYLCLIRNLDEESCLFLTDEEIEDIRAHPVCSVEMLRSQNMQVYSIDDIILEHHENAQGQGFPRTLGASQISPLSCVLILAEEMALLIKASQDFNMPELWKNFVKGRDKGNFRAPLEALGKALGQN